MLRTRRQFFQLMLGTMAGAAVTASCSSILKTTDRSRKQLNIYSWPDYIQPEAIPEFEKRYGIKVVYDTAPSNEALIAKFQGGASDYDIIVPSNYAVSKLKELNCLRPIETDRLKNLHNLMPRFQKQPFNHGSVYAIPYTFGTTGIAFNTKACGRNSEPRDWDAFWDKRYAGRMTLLEDPRETIGFALKRLGYSYNSRNERELQAAWDSLKEQKKLNMCYSSDQVIIYLASGDSLLSLSFSGDAQQAARTNKDIRYVIPASGTSMWVDNLCIPAHAPHLDYAHLWIDFMLEPRIAAGLSNYTYYASPNAAARPLISSELLTNPNLYPPDSILDHCEEIEDIGQTIFLYDRLWTELKCI